MELCGCHGQDVGRFPWLSVGFGGVVAPSLLCVALARCVVALAVFTKNLCSQMSAISGPLLQWLEDRLEQNKQRVQELQQEKEQLLEELAALE